MSEPLKRVVLIGLTGFGKSSLINLILDSKVCETSPSIQSVTREIQMVPFTNNGIQYEFFDTQGLSDTRDSQVNVRSKIASAIRSCLSGVDVFILCVHLGRFTDEQKDALDFLMRGILGEESLKNTILAITHASDDLAMNSGSSRLEKILDLKKSEFFSKLLLANDGAIHFIRNEPTATDTAIEEINAERREICRGELSQTLEQWNKPRYQLRLMESTIKKYDEDIIENEKKMQIAQRERDEKMVAAATKDLDRITQGIIKELRDRNEDFMRKLQEQQKKGGIISNFFRSVGL